MFGYGEGRRLSQALSSIAFAQLTSPHRSTGQSLYYAVYGIGPVLSIERQLCRGQTKTSHLCLIERPVLEGWERDTQLPKQADDYRPNLQPA